MEIAINRDVILGQLSRGRFRSEKMQLTELTGEKIANDLKH
jgi:hypothetical protein